MQTSSQEQKAQLRRMIEDVAEVKKALKAKSKNELIQTIMNMMHNQLAMVDAVQVLQTQLKKYTDAEVQKESKEIPNA